MTVKIAPLDFGDRELAFGFEIVISEIIEALNAELVDARSKHVHDADFLLVSLYWWTDIYSFIDYLYQAGINPKKKKPCIIIGNCQALNPRPLSGYFHYAVLGDGESVTVELIRRLLEGESIDDMPAVWGPDKIVTPHVHPTLSGKCVYGMSRSSNSVMNSSRMEIMRGCPMRCQFCQLSGLKPVRHVPAKVIRRAMIDAPTAKVSLVSADFWSHPEAKEIEQILKRAGKHNTGQDIRLDMIKHVKYAPTGRLRFGIEGFSEKTRKKIGKVGSNKAMLEKLKIAFSDVKRKNGEPVSVATIYMIGDLPGENKESVKEFYSTLKDLDRWAGKNDRKLYLFMSVAGFTPSPLTGMECCGANPFTDMQEAIVDSPYYENIVIARRGGIYHPSARILQLLTARGDEKAARVIYYVATKRKCMMHDSDTRLVRELLAAIKKAGIEPESIWSEYESREQLPVYNIEFPVKPRPWK